MENLIVLFVSACLYGQCSFFEITEPTFTSTEQCIEAGKIYTDEMTKAMPESYGSIYCVPWLEQDDFYKWLESQGYKTNRESI